MRGWYYITLIYKRGNKQQTIGCGWHWSRAQTCFVRSLVYVRVSEMHMMCGWTETQQVWEEMQKTPLTPCNLFFLSFFSWFCVHFPCLLHIFSLSRVLETCSSLKPELLPSSCYQRSYFFLSKHMRPNRVTEYWKEQGFTKGFPTPLEWPPTHDSKNHFLDLRIRAGESKREKKGAFFSLERWESLV